MRGEFLLFPNVNMLRLTLLTIGNIRGTDKNERAVSVSDGGRSIANAYGLFAEY